MELDLHTKQQLAGLLAKPAMVTQAHASMLSDLVKAYPYYQPLHLLLARANHNTTQNDHLATAALYNGGGLLHQVVHHPETLNYLNVKLVNAIKADEKQEAEATYIITEKQDTQEENIFVTTPDEEPEVYDEISEVAVPTNEPANEDEIYSPVGVIENDDQPEEEDEIHEEISEVNSFTHPVVEPKVEKLIQEEETNNSTTSIPEQLNTESDNQEVFDEIVELNQASFSSLVAADLPPEPEIHISDELNDLEIESIVSTDFFAFEQKMDSEPISIAKPEEYSLEAEAQTVSKYYDDKLPYTFLWWLAKTRKEHEQIFQPYATAKKNSNIGLNPLQQQYVEHIFHLQTPFNEVDELAKGPINRNVVHKDAEIIDSFIRNEPQIRPPKGDQLNNENKAKKSAQDNYDLVSETLAAIYIEQMLYHKAIDTYEKLSLKFPEKSRYFADLIQSLEKKI